MAGRGWNGVGLSGSKGVLLILLNTDMALRASSSSSSSSSSSTTPRA